VKLSDLDAQPARDLYAELKFASCGARPPEVPSNLRTCIASFGSSADLAACAPASPLEPAESKFGEGVR
jgi:hypothetical protein